MEREEKSTAQQSGEKSLLINKGEQGVGRAGHESHDISQVDCQEGNMNNGALGGNFESMDQQGNEENKREI